MSVSILSSPPQSSTHENPHPVYMHPFLFGVLFATITHATTQNNNDNSNEAQENGTNVNNYDLPLRFFGAPVAIWTKKIEKSHTTTSPDYINFCDFVLWACPLVVPFQTTKKTMEK